MESTLALKKSDFYVKTAQYLGWGRGADLGDQEWSDEQAAYLKDFTDSACRRFYWPALPGGQTYEWSFMRPVATLTLADGDGSLELPDDFGGMEGRVTVSSSDSSNFCPVSFVGVGQVYERFIANEDATGFPVLVCHEPVKGTGHNRSSRGRLKFFPTADADYTIRFAYYLLADCLTDAYPYAYGGAAHAETLLEGCKAAAELTLDDIANGPHEQMFQQRLVASVNQDRRLKPQLMGYNGDRSDYLEGRGWLRRDSASVVTFDGVSYP